MIDEPDQDTLILVYFSGHGTLHPRFKCPSLVCFNTDPDDPDSTGIQLSFLNEMISHSTASLVLILDACFAGNLGIASASSQISLLGAKAIFASCAEGEKSFAAPGGDQSLFTKQLVAGLRGHGLAAPEGEVNTTSLRDHLLDAFSDASQTPICLVPETPILLSVPGRPVAASTNATALNERDVFTQSVRKFLRELRALPVFAHSGHFVRPNAMPFEVLKISHGSKSKETWSKQIIRSGKLAGSGIAEPPEVTTEVYDALDQLKDWTVGTGPSHQISENIITLDLPK